MRDRAALIFGKEKWRLAAAITTVTIIVLIIALSVILKAGKSGRGTGNAICVYNGNRISAMTNIEILGQNPPPAEVQYGFSPVEIAERIEGVCKMKNMLGQELGELGSLPQENINVLIYLAKGNRVLFLPEGKANATVREGNKGYYSKESKGYLFYELRDCEEYEQGVPVNSIESSYIRYCLAVDKKDTEQVHSCSLVGINIYEMEDIVWLGEASVDFGMQSSQELPKIDINENGYVDAALAYISDTLKQAGEYGSYDIYINCMERIQSDKSGSGYTGCSMDFVILGNGRAEHAIFIIYDQGDINKEHVFSLSGPHLADSRGYFSDYHSEEENQENVSEIMEKNRGMVHLEVTEQTGTDIIQQSVYETPDYNSELDFRRLSSRECAELVSYVCSYSEWFGMNELGYREGEIRGFQGKEIVLYSWSNTGDVLFFVPLEKTNALFRNAAGEECPVYINETGDMEFYLLERNPYAGGMGQLKTSFITSKCLATRFIESMVKLGQEEIQTEALFKTDMPQPEEDEFIQAVERQIEDLLRQAEMQGEYEIQIGEYELFFENKACISAVVTGEQEYYVRYLIVRYGDDRYYFRPVGFGSDGSLEECEVGRHRMNQICAERTKLLNREKIKVNI